MQTRQPLRPTQMTPTTTEVIGSQYCTPFPTTLEIVPTANTFANEFCVRNVCDNNSVFTLERPSFSLHKRCILLHHGNPIVTLRGKIMTAHNRWQVLRGKSDQINDLLFSVKRPNKGYNILQPKTTLELQVFLAKNAEEKVCEFKVEGNWSNGSCEVYSVQPGNQMVKHAVQVTGSDNFVVKVEANVDTAFIVTLIAILSLE